MSFVFFSIAPQGEIFFSSTQEMVGSFSVESGRKAGNRGPGLKCSEDRRGREMSLDQLPAGEQ